MTMINYMLNKMNIIVTDLYYQPKCAKLLKFTTVYCQINKIITIKERKKLIVRNI